MAFLGAALQSKANLGELGSLVKGLPLLAQVGDLNFRVRAPGQVLPGDTTRNRVGGRSLVVSPRP